MVGGVGLGLRRDVSEELLTSADVRPAFLEFAPENWMQVGGYWGRRLRELSERYPFTCHGLSLSLGSPEPLDWEFLASLKQFFIDVPIEQYTEHLSFCRCDNAHLYDLLPIPFCEEAVKHVAARIRTVQDFLERRIAIENVSYYAAIAPQMGESQFIRAILEEADCDLLLDVNNVYVNAFNHGYDARAFIDSLPLARVTYVHMAGHEQQSPTLIIDTHGQPIIDPVYDLFGWAIQKIKPVPVLLERDYNIPSLPELGLELGRLQTMVEAVWGVSGRMAHAA